MRAISRIAVLVAAVVATVIVFGLGSSSAQIPDEFKNLKVLPKDISKRELVPIMRSFAMSLGVRCAECHVSTKAGSEKLEDLDFASDDKQDKKTARQMLRMVDSINEQIAKIGLEEPTKVRCITCHHGVKKPQTLGAVLMGTVEKDGIDAAVERYRKLREDYYGTAAYDFSPRALIEIAGNLADSKKDLDGAMALLKLNLEFNPKSADTHTTLGRIHFAKGDKAAAIASYEKALEIEPDNRWAKMQLERAKSSE